MQRLLHKLRVIVFLDIFVLHDMDKRTCTTVFPGTSQFVNQPFRRIEAVALLVDQLIGQHQVVVKNLESNYRKVPGISAATILGDGSVALIVDVSALQAINRRQAIHPGDDPQPLIERGWVVAQPITYEDFLPVSAAGIFQSNLGNETQTRSHGNASREAFGTV